MKKVFLLVVLILTFGFVQAQKAQEKLVRALPDFSSLRIENSFLGNVILCQSPESKLEIAVESEDNNAEYIVSEVTNGELTLSIKEHLQNSLYLKVLYIKIYSPKFNSIISRGTCDITIEGRLSGENFTMDISGPGKTKIYELQMSKNIVINMSGARSTDIKKCQAEDIVMQIAKAGNFKVGEISGMTLNNKVTISTNGVGNRVFENVSAEKLFLKKNSAGDVKVTGNVVDVNIYNDGVGKFNAAGLSAEYATVVNNSLNAINLKVLNTAYISGYGTDNNGITSKGEVKITGPAKVIQKVPKINKETGEEEGEMELLIK